MSESEKQPTSVGRRLNEGWLAIVARFGFVQTLVILSFFYAILIGIGGIIARIARQDFLDKRGLREPGSAWRDADTAAPDLERAKLAS